MKNYLLRSIALTVVLCFTSQISKAQFVTIPDAAFVNYLQTNFPACISGNQLDTTCSAIVNVTKVNCGNRPSLKNLSGIQYFDNLDTLVCGFDSIITMPVLPASLRYLNCSLNKLTALPFLPAGLTYLDCNSNKLTSLPALPASLTSINCSYNLLTSLPALPGALTWLDCDFNSITTLPALPGTLDNFGCSSNHLTALPSLPASLRFLYCAFNQITTLPVLPTGLLSLVIYDNIVTNLPASLPPTLQYLDFIFNQVSVLPALPPTLTYLGCGNNNLSVIPTLPDSLQTFYCGSNHLLATIPTLPATVVEFECGDLPLLTSIPELPDSLHYFYVEDCPNLHCLPRLKKVVHFYFGKYLSTSGITCLPNYPELNEESIPALDTVLLCDPYNPAPCAAYWNISGNVFNDVTPDCVKNTGETNVHNMKVNLYNNNGVLQQQNYSAIYGAYSFAVSNGTYTMGIDTTGIPFTLVCPASGFDTSVITALDSVDYNKDFALQCKPGFDVGAWSVVANNGFQPAHYSYIHINAGDLAQFWAQTCNTANLSGQLVTTITGPAAFIAPAAGALTPVVSGNTLTYDILDWSLINPNTDFNITVQTDTTAVLGSQVCFSVNVTPTAGDNNTANNNLTQCFTIVGSFDPNEKEVSPTGNVAAGDWLTYTVHFQNTGTAAAENIYVADTLDAHVDAASFQLLAFSHQPVVLIKGNVVRFTFPNINLPDSNTSEPASHGYVQYKVKVKDHVSSNTSISNTAFIYFDFNAAVVTNTVTNTVPLGTDVATINLKPVLFGIYPNPAANIVTISVDETLIGSTATITDVTGRKIADVLLSTVNRELSTESFANGLYLISLTGTGSSSATKKLIIQK